MKSFAIASGLVMLLAATAAAGDLAVSKSTLKGMGLGGMQKLSDDAGLTVRGKGPFDSRFFNLGPNPGGNFPAFHGPTMNHDFGSGLLGNLGIGGSGGGSPLGGNSFLSGLTSGFGQLNF